MQVKFDQKLCNLQMFPINEDGAQLGNRVNQMPSGWEELFLDEALWQKTQEWKKLFAMPDHYVIFSTLITNLINRMLCHALLYVNQK